MFESIIKLFKKNNKKEALGPSSKETAKERLHLVLMQDRANVSADFLDLMRQEIIEVIKKYIDIDEKAIDVRLTNQTNDDGTQGAPALYANIPILNIKENNKNTEEKRIKPIIENKKVTSIMQNNVVKESIKAPKNEDVIEDKEKRIQEIKVADKKIENKVELSKEESSENNDEPKKENENEEKKSEQNKENLENNINEQENKNKSNNHKTNNKKKNKKVKQNNK